MARQCVAKASTGTVIDGARSGARTDRRGRNHRETSDTSPSRGDTANAATVAEGFTVVSYFPDYGAYPEITRIGVV
jgi:hypothetical protein